jgi:molybdopterin-guanine dinucleotide biosynthesis protein A
MSQARLPVTGVILAGGRGRRMCGQRKVEAWLQQVEAAPVDFSNDQPAFANINMPGDL